MRRYPPRTLYIGRADFDLARASAKLAMLVIEAIIAAPVAGVAVYVGALVVLLELTHVSILLPLKSL